MHILLHTGNAIFLASVWLSKSKLADLNMLRAEGGLAMPCSSI